MPLSGVEIIGFSFIVKLFASWAFITLLVSSIVGFVQARAGTQGGSVWRDPWERARRNRRAAIIRSYPGGAGE
jgi:hypothetical protein